MLNWLKKDPLKDATPAEVMQTRPFPLTIEAWAALGDGVILGQDCNSNYNVPHNTFRRYDADWNEIWATNIKLTPVKITVTDDAIYALTWEIVPHKTFLHRIDPETGEVVWRLWLRSAMQPTAPLVVGDLVLVGGDTRLWAVRADKGKTKWSHKLERVDFDPVVCPECDTVIVGDAGGELFGLDLKTGEPVWTREFNGRNVGAFCFAGAYWAGPLFEPLERIEPATGLTVDRMPLPYCSHVVAQEGRAYFQTKSDDDRGYRIGCVDVAKLKRVWEVDVPIQRGNGTFAPDPVCVRGDALLVRTLTGPVYTLALADGKMRSAFTLEAAQQHNPDIRELGALLLPPTGSCWVQTRQTLFELDF